MIGDDIEVSVLAVSRDKIRIGITAPKEVPVFRKEVWISIKDDEGSMGGADDDSDAVKDPAANRNGIEDAIIDGAAAKVEEALGRKE